MAFINIQGVVLAFDGNRLFEEINLNIEQGEKVALVGRNGSGKSTLLKLIDGNIRPDSGIIAIQKGIRSVYLDQMVPGEMGSTVFEVVKGGLNWIQDTLETEGGWEHRQKVEKVISQLGLDKERVFNMLSAGLKRQVLLAKALIAGPDILLLDEPTNDLDLETLELLEDYLLNYSGTILLVSHDRAFINNVVTGTLVFEGDSTVKEYVGDYDDWLRQRPPEAKPAKAETWKKSIPLVRAFRPKAKFGFRQQKELESLPQTIQELETEQEELYRAMGDPGRQSRSKAKSPLLMLSRISVALSN